MVQTVVLECAGLRRGPDDVDDGDGSREGIATEGERGTVLLHLWDEQMCLTSLFQKGDGLALYWPWLVQSDLQDAAGGRIGFSQAPSHSSQASWRGCCLRAGERASAQVVLGFCAHRFRYVDQEEGGVPLSSLIYSFFYKLRPTSSCLRSSNFVVEFASWSRFFRSF